MREGLGQTGLLSEGENANRIPTRILRAALNVVMLCFPVALLSMTSSAEVVDREEALRQVRAYVQEHHWDDALQAVRRLVDQNPRDFEARNWVGRLESWKGRYKEAEELYRKVLVDDPNNLEAELGLSDVLARQKRYSAAIAVLEGLQKGYPNNLEVLLRLGRFSLWQNNRRSAIHFYQKALCIDPKNKEARGAVTLLETEKPFHLEVGYFSEAYDFAKDTKGQFVELVYRDYDRKSLLGRFQYQNKFKENDTLFTGGATYRVLSRTWLRGEVSLAPRGQVVVPNQDYSGELTQGFSHGVGVGIGHRYMNFSRADVQVPTALLNWDVQPNLHFYLRYTPAGTRFKGSQGRMWNHGGWARLAWDANSFLSPYLLFATGVESFATVSAEQLGRFTAHTYGGGVEFRVTKTQGLRFGYLFQSRTQGHHEQSVGVSYFLSF